MAPCTRRCRWHAPACARSPSTHPAARQPTHPCRPLLCPDSGATPNPAGRGHTHGGGDYGAAVAVAAGLADLALAVDELGSARVPAACCGGYALRTTAGALPLEGAATAAASLAAPALLARDPQALLKAGQALRLPGGAPAQPKLCILLRRRCACRHAPQVEHTSSCGMAAACSWPTMPAPAPHPRPAHACLPRRRGGHRGAALPGGRRLFCGLRPAGAGHGASRGGGCQGAGLGLVLARRVARGGAVAVEADAAAACAGACKHGRALRRQCACCRAAGTSEEHPHSTLFTPCSAGRGRTRRRHCHYASGCSIACRRWPPLFLLA